MRDIAPDERRRHRPKGARRFAVVRRGAPGASRGLSVVPLRPAPRSFPAHLSGRSRSLRGLGLDPRGGPIRRPSHAMNVSFASQRPSGACGLALRIWSEDMLSDRLSSLGEPARTPRRPRRRRAEVRARARRRRRNLRPGRRDRAPAAPHRARRQSRRSGALRAGGRDGHRPAPGLPARRGSSWILPNSTCQPKRRRGSASVPRRAPGATSTYRTKFARKQKPTLEEVVIVGAGDGAEAAWRRSLGAARRPLLHPRAGHRAGQHRLSRDASSNAARKRLEPLGVEIEDALDEAKMTSSASGRCSASAGLAEPPHLLVMRWNGGGGRPGRCLVGKGITFDASGISIKPADGMEDMKWDMGGAGAVTAR